MDQQDGHQPDDERTAGPVVRGTRTDPRPPPPSGGASPWASPVRPVRPTRPPRPPDPAPARLLALAVAGGVALDLGLRGGLANALVALGIGLVVIGLVTGRRLRRRGARALALAALVPAAGLALRASPWLVAANLVAVGGLLGAAVATSRSGSVFDTSAARLLRRLGAALPQAWSAPRALQPLLPTPSGRDAARARAVARALGLAVPVLAVVVALLASADAVFAGLLTPDVSLGPITGHVLLASAAALAVLATIGASAADPTERVRSGRYGVVEVGTMLGLAAAVLGLFSLAQLLALTDAGDRLVASSGLTPAEYARSGFFQLCWATGILLAFLGLVRRVATPDVLDRPGIRVLGGLVPLLGLTLVGVSLRRMALYDDAFGLTVLRLAVVGAAGWFGVVLLLVAVRNLGLGRSRDWVFGGAAAAALVLVLLANGSDPEAFVVRHDVARARAGEGVELDAGYLAGLSDDAVPALVEAARTEQDPARQAALLAAIGCEDATGTASLNRAAQRAADARDLVCSDRIGAPTA